MQSTPRPELDFSRLRMAELAQLRAVALQREDRELLALVEAEWKRREQGWQQAQRPPPRSAATADPAHEDLPPEAPPAVAEREAVERAEPELAWSASDAPPIDFCHVLRAEGPVAFSTYRLSRPHLLRP